MAWVCPAIRTVTMSASLSIHQVFRSNGKMPSAPASPPPNRVGLRMMPPLAAQRTDRWGMLPLSRSPTFQPAGLMPKWGTFNLGRLQLKWNSPLILSMTPFTFSLAAVTGVMMADLMPFQMEDTVFFRPLKRLPTVVFTPVTTPTTPDLIPFQTVVVTDWMPCQMLLTVFFTALMPVETPFLMPPTTPVTQDLMPFHTVEVTVLMPFQMALTVFFTALTPLVTPLRMPFQTPSRVSLIPFQTAAAVSLMLFHRPASVAWKDCQAYHVLSKKPRMPSRALRVTVWMVSKTP